ncbi:MAG: NAD(P)/FAD-dependent oxidoreductase, partial [Acidobacteriota bacterium]
QGRYLAKLIRKRLHKPDYQPEPFRYVDKGNMAVIGRRMAVADIKGLEFAGGFAWLLWLFVHLMYLAEFQNRVLVIIQWGWNYLTRNRSARLITGALPEPAPDDAA